MSNIPMSKAIADIEKITLLCNPENEGSMSIDDAIEHVVGYISDMPVDKATGFMDACDRYLHVWHGYEVMTEFVDKQHKKYAQQKKSLKGQFDRFKDRLKYFMSENPDLEFAGSEERFRLTSPGGISKLVLNFKAASKTYSGIVTEKQIEEHKIPENCYKKVEFYQLDNKACREYMKSSDFKKTDNQVIDKDKIIDGSCNFGRLEKSKNIGVI